MYSPVVKFSVPLAMGNSPLLNLRPKQGEYVFNPVAESGKPACRYLAQYCNTPKKVRATLWSGFGHYRQPAWTGLNIPVKLC
jgi:hypothetical protein